MARLFTLLVAALLCATGGPSAAATAQPATAAQGQTVSIPFAPPLDRALRYRVTRTTSRAPALGRAWSDYEIIFSRRSSGYRMHVRVIDVGAAGLPAGDLADFRRFMIEASPPFVLLLGEDAALEGMEDADAYWESMLRAVERIFRQAEGAGLDEAVLGQAAAMMRESSPEGRLNLLTQYLLPIVELAGTEQVLGAEVADELHVDGAMGLSLRQQIRMRAERIEDGRLFITSRTSIPEAEMRRATQELLARIPVTGEGANTAAGREQAAAQLAAARISREMESRYELLLETGLLARFSSEERISVEMADGTQRQVQTVLIERLGPSQD